MLQVNEILLNIIKPQSETQTQDANNDDDDEDKDKDDKKRTLKKSFTHKEVQSKSKFLLLNNLPIMILLFHKRKYLRVKSNS